MVAVSTTVDQLMAEALRDRLDLLRPEWLVIGALLAVSLLYASRVSLVDFTERQRRLSLWTRALIVLLLATAAAGLTWYRRAVDYYVVIAVDRSASVGPEARRLADLMVNRFQQALEGQRLAVIEFAARPGPVQEWPFTQRTDASSESNSPDEPLETDLAAAVDAARAAIPPGHVAHLVLVTDGQQTQGDVLTSVASADMPVSTIALPPREQPEVQISEVHVPAEVKVGEPFYVDAVINANQPTNAQIELYSNDLRVELGESGQVELRAGENQVRLRQQLDAAQSVTYTARVRAASDTRLDDNTASAMVVVAGRPRVLLVDREVDSVDGLRWAWEDQEITVDVVPPSGLPSSLAELIGYDAIVLSDVPASEMSPAQQQWLRQYVEVWGGGLLMLGGEQSFGLGGYDKTPLAAILPVRSDREQEREKPSLAMVLVIDRSGSMGGLKLDLAKDAARGTAELLGPRDQLGVVAFDDDAYWVSPLRSAADRRAVIDRINRLSSAGGTNLYPALAEALTALRSAAAKLKHVIVLSDGISAPADFDRLVAEMVAQQIVVSTVAVGDQADRTRLQKIAQQGSGRYYECDDPRAIPQIFAQETIMASQSAIDEEPFLPRAVRATSVLRGIDLTSIPLLLGHVVTRAKATSEVILVSEKGDPILAWWRYGLGMVLAFTSDAKARWATEWLSWPDFSAFWTQSLRHVMRQTKQEGGQLHISRRGGVTRVTLELLDGDDAFVNLAQTRLSLLRPGEDDRPQELVMQQTAPGTYVAEFQSHVPGLYFLDVVSRTGEQLRFRQSMGTFVGYPDELRLRPPDTVLLQQIAVRSGGWVNPTPDRVLMTTTTGPLQAVPLWRALVTLALMLWLVDVALRRLDWFSYNR
jgi:Ca-activated chloride channel family protein